VTTARRSTVNGTTSGGLAPSMESLWSIKDVSRYLGIPVATLYQWRVQGSGPRAFRCGRHLRYDPAEVRRWLDQQAA
jgi:predicted DNA-binding transcriptional regulator AlpA